MKLSSMVFAASFLFSTHAYAAFSCKVWNTPVGSGDTFSFDLKPISPSEPYMLKGKIHDLEITAMIFETGKGYSVQAVEPKDLERGFVISTDLPFMSDSTLAFHYPVPALNDIIALNIQCKK